MKSIGGAIARGALAMAGRKSPWGGGNKGSDGGDASGTQEGAGSSGAPEPLGGPDPAPDAPPSAPPKGPRNPWLPSGEQVPPRRSASIEDIFRSRDKKGGGSGGGGGGGNGFPRLPPRADGKSWVPLIAGIFVLLWLGASTTHMIGPKEEGIVSTFGKYSRTITPGVSLTMPWPFQSVSVRDVTSINRYTIPEGEAEKLMLTSDQNLVDLSYLVRWKIKDLKLFTYRLADPEETVREVAEAAMRTSIAEVSLDAAISGAGRGKVEQNVRQRMQEVLDAYRAGVSIQGVEIKKADPPEKVISAFQQVTSAQQDSERDQSNARAWAQQLLARAQGDAASFDKVYEQYRLSPEVTKRRMYYETMERVLGNNDKVIMETQGGTTFLPLPEMRKRATTQAAPDPAATPPKGAQ